MQAGFEVDTQVVWSEKNTTIWTFALDLWSTSSQLIYYRWNGISDTEFAQAELFKDQQLKDRFIARRGILRSLLSQYVTRGPKEIEIETSDFGKPFIRDYPLWFSSSHSGDRGLVAISTDCEIGVDIQQHCSKLVDPHFEFFTLAEQESVMCSKNSESEFFRIWSRKESCIKAVGRGLSQDLTSFDVLHDYIEMPEVLRLQDFGTGPGYSAAIAMVQK